MTLPQENFWKKCSSCKKPIGLGVRYYICNVSTCQGDRTGYVFCGMQCFENHLPGARHRSAGAIEKIAPKSIEAVNINLNSAQQESNPGRKIIIGSSASSGSGVSTAARNSSSMSNEVLVVVSKMKQYIKDISDMNTSEEVNQTISNFIRIQLDRAIENAKKEGRKTVMSRDFK